MTLFWRNVALHNATLWVAPKSPSLGEALTWVLPSNVATPKMPTEVEQYAEEPSKRHVDALLHIMEVGETVHALRFPR